jgi:hypothetical protein
VIHALHGPLRDPESVSELSNDEQGESEIHTSALRVEQVHMPAANISPRRSPATVTSGRTSTRKLSVNSRTSSPYRNAMLNSAVNTPQSEGTQTLASAGAVRMLGWRVRQRFDHGPPVAAGPQTVRSQLELMSHSLPTWRMHPCEVLYRTLP